MKIHPDFLIYSAPVFWGEVICMEPTPPLLNLIKIIILLESLYKRMLRSILRCFAILFGIEFILYIGLIATAMTDGKVPAIAGYFYWPLKYAFSFPLALLNRDYPYFLDGGGTTMEVLFLGTLNNLLLAIIFVGMINACRKVLKIEQ